LNLINCINGVLAFLLVFKNNMTQKNTTNVCLAEHIELEGKILRLISTG